MPPKEKGDKGGSRAGSGRPSFVSKDISPSRSKYQCPVCGSEKRADKLQIHLQQLCIFDTDGNPLESSDEQYKTLSTEAKQHTEYCSRKGLKKDELAKCWKRLSPSNQGLNPFERAKKKQPSEPLRQAINFTSEPNASTSENPPLIANSLIPADDAPNSPATDAPNSPVIDFPNSPVTNDPNLPHADPPDPPDGHDTDALAIPTMVGDQCATSGNGEYKCTMNIMYHVYFIFSYVNQRLLFVSPSICCAMNPWSVCNAQFCPCPTLCD